MENSISAVGCFGVVYTRINGKFKIVLVRRKDGGYLELPGGGLDPALDIIQNTDPFVNCVRREVEEESGLVLSESSLFNRSVLVQRILIGTEGYVIGTVHVYSEFCPELNGTEFIKKLTSFTSDETSEVVVVSIDEGFFDDTGISLASKRMIASALMNVEVGGKNNVAYSSLSQPQYVGRLADVVFKIDV